MASDMKSAPQRGGGDGEANARPTKLQTSASEKQAAKVSWRLIYFKFSNQCVFSATDSKLCYTATA
jgi:hypothetical protein